MLSFCIFIFSKAIVTCKLIRKDFNLQRLFGHCDKEFVTKSQMKWKTDCSIMGHVLGPIFMTPKFPQIEDLLCLSMWNITSKCLIWSHVSTIISILIINQWLSWQKISVIHAGTHSIGREARASALLQVGLQGHRWFLGQVSLQSHVPSKTLKVFESRRFPV